MSSHFCTFRGLAEVALILSFPVLIGRIWKRGNSGISATTQGLHLIVFLLRYCDVTVRGLENAWESGLSWSFTARVAWTPWLKLYLITASAAVLIAMKIRGKRSHQQCTVESVRRGLREYALYIVPAFLIAYRFNYTSFSWLSQREAVDVVHTYHTFGWVASIMRYFSLSDLINISGPDFDELAWAVSIFLAAFADIPQYLKYYQTIKGGMDWWLMSAMALFASGRMLYIAHWILRFMENRVFDPLSFIGGAIQAFAFWMILVLSISKATDCIGDSDLDLEAQMAAYDAEQWGELLPEENDQHKK